VKFEDLIQGSTSQNVAQVVGDFVIQSKDETASYQLAVTVDDALTDISQVIRGGDLLSSTPRQIQLFECFGHSSPSFAHVPLVLGEDGKRLAKRDGAFAISCLRRANVEPAKVIGFLAKLLGLAGGEPTELDVLKESFSLKRICRSSARITEDSIIRALGLG
jgi:glutamyl-tRNA synthetase